jgi:hypothetical protein
MDDLTTSELLFVIAFGIVCGAAMLFFIVF